MAFPLVAIVNASPSTAAEMSMLTISRAPRTGRLFGGILKTGTGPRLGPPQKDFYLKTLKYASEKPQGRAVPAAGRKEV